MNRPTKDWYKIPVKGVLLGNRGVLQHEEPNDNLAAKVGYKYLQTSEMPYRIITNQCNRKNEAVADILRSKGYEIPQDKIVSPLTVLRNTITHGQMDPHYLLHNSVLGDLPEHTCPHNCVVIGEAGDNFTQENFKDTIECLRNMEEPRVYILAQGSYLNQRGKYNLPKKVKKYIQDMEEILGKKVTIMGKPAKYIFQTAAIAMGLRPENVVMIGSDLDQDIRAAEAAGMRAILINKKPSSLATLKPSDIVVRNLYSALKIIF